MKILIVGTLPESLVNFRGKLIIELISKRHNVIAISDKPKCSTIKLIEEYGAKHISINFSRTSINPLKNIQTFFSLIKIFNSERPDSILAYTSKPVIWSGFACIFFPKIRFVPLITGLGYAFGGKGFFRKLIQFFSAALYKHSLKQASKIIFQNSQNREYFIKKRIVSRSKSIVINGSGVDLDFYKYDRHNENIKNLSFLMISRLLKDKGVIEYFEAAKIVKSKYPQTMFLFVGGIDPSPNRISQKEIDKYKDLNIVEFKGHLKDVRTALKESSVFVLPSYHEGMSRSIQEALATGRPIITTNVPGCREGVKFGKNGFLINKGSYDQLAAKMIWFIENPELILNMGAESRKIAEQLFDVNKINKQIIDILI